ncbi:MAG: hypothetical protein HY886_11085 [Deltaproteobacteria bacterium]|nr:hypothetical protein [Deltaproteobacteria bacterium]
MKASFALFLLVLLSPVQSLGNEKPSLTSTQGFKVSLPEGLYLYQPTLKRNAFSPLFIVKGETLLEPYVMAEVLGLGKFSAQYLDGRVFKAYVESERFGLLRDARLEIFDYCMIYSPGIKVYGRHMGVPLPEEAIEGSLYEYKGDLTYFTNEGALKALLMEAALQGPKRRMEFKVTEEDIKTAKDTARAIFRQEAMDRATRDFEKLGRVTSYGPGAPEEEEMIYFLAASDLDGNGKKELIGHYSISFKRFGGWYGEMLFSVWDTGVTEKITGFDEDINDIRLGGAIDIDGDGTQELIAQAMIHARDIEGEYGEGYIEEGKRVEVFRHGASGWRKVFHTRPLCERIEK